MRRRTEGCCTFALSEHDKVSWDRQESGKGANSVTEWMGLS